jgi:hypothetical protein
MRWVEAVIGILLVLSLLGQGSTALHRGIDTDLLFCSITYPEGNYSVGSNVTFTIHVFDGAEYTDVDTVEMMVLSDRNMDRHIEITKKATGLWTGELTVMERDVGFTGSWITLFAKVAAGEDLATGSVTISLENPYNLAVTATIGGGGLYLRPGDSRTITWQVTLNGEPVNASLSDLQIPGIKVPENIGVGTYRLNYTAPNYSGSEEVGFTLTPYYSDDYGQLHLRGYKRVSLFVTHMRIWAERVGKATGSSATFDLHISDFNGTPIEDARVYLDYDYPTEEGGHAFKNLEATSDSDGIARVVLSYGDVDKDGGVVDITGDVLFDDLSQDIEHKFRVHEPIDTDELPDDDGLYIIGRDDYRVDADETYEATLYYDGEPLASSWVNCYLVTRHGILAHVNVTTGPDGTISFPFRTPREDQHLIIFMEADVTIPWPEWDRGTGIKEKYVKEREIIYIGEFGDPWENELAFWRELDTFRTSDMSIEVELLEKGRPTTITMGHPDAEAHWEGLIYLGCDYTPFNVDRVPKWTYWSLSEKSSAFPEDGGGTLCDVGEYKEGVWHARITIPENLPNDDFFLWGHLSDTYWYNPDGTFDKVNSIEGMRVGEGARTGDPTENGDGTGSEAWIGILVLVLLCMIIAILVTQVIRTSHNK